MTLNSDTSRSLRRWRTTMRAIVLNVRMGADPSQSKSILDQTLRSFKNYRTWLMISHCQWQIAKSIVRRDLHSESAWTTN